jgi:thiol-disulfide isomerase/thioredoxin
MRTLLVALLLGGLSLQAAPIPRPAAPLAFTEAGKAARTLTSMKGKVVVVQFLLTTCGHCQAFSRALAKLTTELGPKFQAVGLAFDPGDAANVPTYIQTVGANFPVAAVPKQDMLNFLGYSVMQYNNLRVPQVAVIDKKGVLRSQTEVSGIGPASDEKQLKALLETLLKEK